MTRTVAFSDIFDLQRRTVPVDLDHQYREVGVRSFGRGLFVKEPVSGLQLGSKRVFFIHRGDLVISNVFGWEGAVAVAGGQHHGLIGSHRFMTWTPTSDVDVGYVHQFLISDSGLQLLREASPGSAGRNRTLSVKNLLRIPIPLRPLTEQRRIADHLDAFGAVPSAAGSLRYTPVGQLIAGLEWERRVGDLMSLDVTEQRVDDSEVYTQVGVLSRGRGLFRRGSLAGADTSYRTLNVISAHQVVVSRLKAFEGAVAVAPDWADGSVASKEFPTFTISPAVDPTFVRAVLRTPRLFASLATVSNGIGARRERISIEGFLSLPFPRATERQSAQVVKAFELEDRAGRLTERRLRLSRSLLPAARNEIFSSMR